MYVTCVFKSNLLYIFELWSSLLESSSKISKFYAITYYEHKFHKAGIKNLTGVPLTGVLPIEIRSYNHRLGTHRVSPPTQNPHFN